MNTPYSEINKRIKNWFYFTLFASAVGFFFFALVDAEDKNYRPAELIMPPDWIRGLQAFGVILTLSVIFGALYITWYYLDQWYRERQKNKF